MNAFRTTMTMLTAAALSQSPALASAQEHPSPVVKRTTAAVSTESPADGGLSLLVTPRVDTTEARRKRKKVIGTVSMVAAMVAVVGVSFHADEIIAANRRNDRGSGADPAELAIAILTLGAFL